MKMHCGAGNASTDRLHTPSDPCARQPNDAMPLLLFTDLQFRKDKGLLLPAAQRGKHGLQVRGGQLRAIPCCYVIQAVRHTVVPARAAAAGRMLAAVSKSSPRKACSHRSNAQAPSAGTCCTACFTARASLDELAMSHCRRCTYAVTGIAALLGKCGLWAGMHIRSCLWHT